MNGQDPVNSDPYTFCKEMEVVIIILKRKVVTAILSSVLFALIFSLAGGFESNRFLNIFFNLYYLNLLFVITYGVIASLFSDWLSRKIAKRYYARELTSLVLHCCCGAVLQVFGLASAVLFFIIDRLLRRVKMGWLFVVVAFSMTVVIFIILIK